MSNVFLQWFFVGGSALLALKSSACKSLEDVLAALRTPSLAVRLEDANMALMTVEVSPLPTDCTIDSVTLGYAMDLAASFGDLNYSSQCSLQWEQLNSGLMSLRQPFAKDGVCRWGWSNSSGVLARSGVVGVFVIAAEGAYRSVLERWQWPVEVQVPARVASLGAHLAVKQATLIGQTFLLAPFDSQVDFYRTDTFTQKIQFPYFKVGDIVYMEHSLMGDTMGMLLSLRVERAWLSTNQSADNLSAVKRDLSDFMKTYAPMPGKARLMFVAELCEYCYLHCVSSLELGRRLSSEPALYLYSSAGIQMFAGEVRVVDPPPPTGPPSFIMNPWGAIALSAILSAITALATRLVMYLRGTRGRRNSRMKFFALMESLDTLSDWGNFFGAWGAGDLTYEDDGGAIRLTLLSICAFCTFCFALELAIWFYDSARLYRALHLVVYMHLSLEDVFQGIMYILVAASHSRAGLGVSISALIGAILCGVFVIGRIIELNFERDDSPAQDLRRDGSAISLGRPAEAYRGDDAH